jgi:hypothetical protein
VVQTGTIDAPRTRDLPLIDPHTLTRPQRAGRRCAVPNCCRLFLHRAAHQVGRLPDGSPVLACEECAPGIAFSRVVTG